MNHRKAILCKSFSYSCVPKGSKENFPPKFLSYGIPVKFQCSKRALSWVCVSLVLFPVLTLARLIEQPDSLIHSSIVRTDSAVDCRENRCRKRIRSGWCGWLPKLGEDHQGSHQRVSSQCGIYADIWIQWLLQRLSLNSV
jgi:hypothetical protein